jgi:probable phosphoglycerate mutase
MPRTAARPRPTVVLLVRHGQTPTTGKLLPGRAPGLHLSETGQAQAAAVGERLAKLPKIDAVYASPLERTKETAGAIAKALGLKVKLDKGLLEADIGDWTGQELKTVSKTPEWKIVHSYPSGFRFPGGESFVEMQTRTVSAIERLRRASASSTCRPATPPRWCRCAWRSPRWRPWSPTWPPCWPTCRLPATSLRRPWT